MPSNPQPSIIQPRVGVGIVGLGFMAATHIKAYRQITGFQIAAICNPSGRNLEGDFSRVAGNIGSAEPLRLDMSRVRAYRSFADLLADPAFVYVGRANGRRGWKASPWGNPFPVGRAVTVEGVAYPAADAATCIGRYREWFARQPHWTAASRRPAPSDWPTNVDAAVPNAVPGIHVNASSRTPTV